MTTAEGRNATFSCNASGNPEPSFSWKTNDGFVVVPGSRIRLSLDKKQLIINNVSRSDSAQYRCVASNSIGNAVSNAASLDVQCKYTRKSKNRLTYLLVLHLRWYRHIGFCLGMLFYDWCTHTMSTN